MQQHLSHLHLSHHELSHQQLRHRRLRFRRKQASSKSLVLALLCLVCAKPIAAATVITEELEVGLLDFGPMFILHKDREPTGILSDILFPTLHRAKLNYYYKMYPAKRLFNNLANGQTDITVGIKDNRLYGQHVLYSEDIIATIELRIYTIGNKPLPTTTKKMLGKHIAVVRGFGYGGRRKTLVHGSNAIYIRQLNAIDQAFTRLKNGRVDYLLGYKQQIDELEKDSPTPSLRSDLIETLQVYFMVRKQHPQALQIMQLLEQNYLPKNVIIENSSTRAHQ